MQSFVSQQNVASAVICLDDHRVRRALSSAYDVAGHASGFEDDAPLTLAIQPTRLAVGLKSKLDQCHLAGLMAKRNALELLGANAHTAWAPCAIPYMDGSSKAKLSLIYERAFDLVGQRLGVDDPAQHRRQ